ncbi:MAG TPA: c-type cytochrome [Polyangiaceae bacterium]|nr:c-type cytochrome [Polyangiaceae bacterium]
MRRTPWSSFVVSLVLLVAPAACDQAPPDLREWKPTDHDHTTNPGQDQVEGGPDAGIEPELAAHGLTEVAMVAWQQNCVRCHGNFGHGDGPQGPMVHAPDLSDARFQARVTEDDIAKTIRDGRGLMPAFPLPDATLKTLAHLVRLLGQTAAAAASDAPAASGSAAPGASAGHGAHPAPAAPHPSAHAPGAELKSPHAAAATSGASAPAPPAAPSR